MGMIAAWVTGALMGLISLVGLIMASAARDGVFQLAGWLIFLFGVLMVFGLIASTVGRKDPD